MATSNEARELLRFHGEVRPQPSTDWEGAIPIPPAVEQFYREVGPVDIFIEGYGNPYFLPRLSDCGSFKMAIDGMARLGHYSTTGTMIGS